MIPGMRARTLGYTLAASGPVWLLALLAIQGRTLTTPWQSPEYGEEESAKILAYAPAIQATRAEMPNLWDGDEATLRRVAQLWIDGHRRGDLQAIRPASADDDGSEGVRQQIEAARRGVIQALMRQTNDAEHVQDWRRVNELMILTLQLAEVAKYNSALSVTNSCYVQLHTIERFETVKPFLSAAQVKEFESHLATLSTNPEKVVKMADHVARISELGPNDAITKINAHHGTQELLNEAEDTLATVSNEAGVAAIRGFQVAYRLESELEDHRGRLVSPTEPGFRLTAGSASNSGL